MSYLDDFWLIHRNQTGKEEQAALSRLRKLAELADERAKMTEKVQEELDELVEFATSEGGWAWPDVADNLKRTILDALSIPADTDWLPITEEMKDGRTILAWFPNVSGKGCWRCAMGFKKIEPLPKEAICVHCGERMTHDFKRANGSGYIHAGPCPPTPEQLIQELLNAGFVDVGICGEFYELKVKDICIGVPAEGDGVALKRGRKMFKIPCPTLQKAVALALSIQENTI